MRLGPSGTRVAIQTEFSGGNETRSSGLGFEEAQKFDLAANCELRHSVDGVSTRVACGRE